MEPCLSGMFCVFISSYGVLVLGMSKQGHVNLLMDISM